MTDAETSCIRLGRFLHAAPRDFFIERYDARTTRRCRCSHGRRATPGTTTTSSIGWRDVPVPVATLVARHSYHEHHLPALLDAAAAAGIESANVLVLASQDQFDAPRTVSGVGDMLWMTGRYSYPI